MTTTVDRDQQFKRSALRHGYLSREQLMRCVQVQNRQVKSKARELGLIAVEQGFIDAAQLKDCYEGKTKPPKVKMIGGYQLVSILGEGGLGIVYKAQQVSMKRDVALKVLHTRWLDDDEFRRRFLLEARLVGKMSHQNLIQVFDVGMDGDKLYFSMEYVRGKNVQQMIDEEGQLEIPRAIDITTQIIRAVNYYKEFGVVHRDVKPSNVMLHGGKIAKLGDFGFIKTKIDKELSREGYILGTPDYISPEQARWEDDIDFRSDIYSLGATLYHMLVGSTPFLGTESAVIRQHMKHTMPSPLAFRDDIPEDLVVILERMMAKNPDDRPDDLGQLCDDLNKVKQGQVLGEGRRLEVGKSTIAQVDLTAKRLQRLENERRGLKLKLERLESSNRQQRLLIAILTLALVLLAVAMMIGPRG